MERTRESGGGSKKRIVAGSARSSLLIMNDDLEDEMEIDPFADCVDTSESSSMTNRRKSNVGRRRSSLIKIPQMSEAEQMRIADMYKTVIQMSSENKLNEKNSWTFDLIDHMGKLIRDESKGVNFQKASCTLDASVKIYANRVDDTYATSHRILESLSRNGTMDDNIEENEDGTKVKAKVGSKSSSTRLNIAQTIEKNPEALNAVKLENDYAFDPMFHKLSKAFDEGGAKGMLLYNMRLSSKSCSLAFLGKDIQAQWNVGEEASIARDTPTTINMHDLMQRSGVTAQSILPLTICPKFAEYRAQIGRDESTVGVIPDSVIAAVAATELAPPAYTMTPPSSSPVATEFSPIAAPMMDFADNFDHAAGFDDFGDTPGPDDYFVDEAIIPASSLARAESPSQAAGTKLRWNVSADDDQRVRQEQADFSKNLESLKLNTANDYGYFDIDDLHSSGNAWAGAKHWKYATRGNKKVPQESSSSETANAEPLTPSKAEKAKKKAAAKKDSAVLTFTLDLVENSKFGSNKSKSKKSTKDTTLLTEAALEKSRNDAASLLLPSDEKLKVRDLCRLFLLPNIVVPPKSVNVLAKNNKSKAAGTRARALLDSMAGEELVWDASSQGIATSLVAGENRVTDIAPLDMSNIGGDDNDADDDQGAAFDDFGGGDYDYDAFAGGNGGASAAGDLSAGGAGTPVSSGLSINQNNLVQAGRMVQKIDINYAKVSKRVNVHKLKNDVWSNIQESLVEQEKTQAPAASSVDKKQLSFQELVHDLASSESQQKEVTISYYFICLLHLANENTLKISDREDLSDLAITMDK